MLGLNRSCALILIPIAQCAETCYKLLFPHFNSVYVGYWALVSLCAD